MLPDFTSMPTLPAADLARAREFYEAVLGFTPDTDMGPDLGVFYASGAGAFLLYPSPFAGTNQATAATWNVTDLDAVATNLREAGVEWTDGVADLGNGVRNIWFRDTEGSILSVFTAPTAE